MKVALIIIVVFVFVAINQYAPAGTIDRLLQFIAYVISILP